MPRPAHLTNGQIATQFAQIALALGLAVVGLTMTDRKLTNERCHGLNCENCQTDKHHDLNGWHSGKVAVSENISGDVSDHDTERDARRGDHPFHMPAPFNWEVARDFVSSSGHHAAGDNARQDIRDNTHLITPVLVRTDRMAEAGGARNASGGGL